MEEAQAEVEEEEEGERWEATLRPGKEAVLPGGGAVSAVGWVEGY